jgi:hypothetical protein
MLKEKPQIRVIGIDRKIHLAEAHNTKTMCGIKILHKNVREPNGFYSCYECMN